MISSVMFSFLKPVQLGRIAFASSQILTVRNFSGTGSLKNSNAVIFQQSLDVKPYGKLFLESYSLPVHISHAPNLTNCIDVCLKGEFGTSMQQAKKDGSGFGLKIRKDESDNSIYISSDAEKPVCAIQAPLLSVEIPPYFDVNVNTLQDNGVQFSNLQSPNIVCCTRDGHVKSTSIKCNQFTLVSQGGNVEFTGPLLGNVDVRTSGSGYIRADHLQGSDITLHTDAGEIKVDAIYANDSIIVCRNSNVLLSNVHGSTRVNLQNGNLCIVGLDGALAATVERGNIDAQVSRLFQNADVVVAAKDGHIVLKLSQDLVTQLQLQGQDVLVEENIERCKLNVSATNDIQYEGSLNNATFQHDPLIRAVAPKGTVTIGIQNWYSKVNVAQ